MNFSHICFAFEINISFAFQSLFPTNCISVQSVSYFSLFRILDKSFRILVNSVFCSSFRFVFRSVFRISAGARNISAAAAGANNTTPSTDHVVCITTLMNEATNNIDDNRLF